MLLNAGRNFDVRLYKTYSSQKALCNLDKTYMHGASQPLWTNDPLLDHMPSGKFLLLLRQLFLFQLIPPCPVVKSLSDDNGRGRRPAWLSRDHLLELR